MRCVSAATRIRPRPDYLSVLSRELVERKISRRLLWGRLSYLIWQTEQFQPCNDVCRECTELCLFVMTVHANVFRWLHTYGHGKDYDAFFDFLQVFES